MRALFRAVFTLQTIAVAVALTLAVVMLVWWPVRALAAAALFGSLLTVGLVGLAGLAALAGFEGAWDRFHFLAFSNDLWRLNPATDHLIQMFPEAFWLDITLLIGAFTLLEALIISGVAVAYLILSRSQEAPKAPPEPRPSLPHPQLPARPRIAPPGPRRYVH